MRTHTGERAYKCELCQKTFSAARSLKNHMRIHTEEKPYVCKFCNKGFAQVGHLKTHMKTHNGEKTHVCAVCNKGFLDAGNLIKHKRTHASEKHHKYNKHFTKNSSSTKQHKLVAGAQPQAIEIECEVAASQCDQLIGVGTTGNVDKPNEHYVHNSYPDFSGTSDPLLSIRHGNRLCISKVQSPLDGRESFSKSFGCGICDILLYTEMEFREHCFSHRFSSPVELLFDQCRILIPHTVTVESI